MGVVLDVCRRVVQRDRANRFPRLRQRVQSISILQPRPADAARRRLLRQPDAGRPGSRHPAAQVQTMTRLSIVVAVVVLALLVGATVAASRSVPAIDVTSNGLKAPPTHSVGLAK